MFGERGNSSFLVPLLCSYIPPRIKTEWRRAQFKLTDDQTKLLIIFI